MLGLMRDIGAWVKGYLALTPAVITAGAGNDGVEVDGGWVDVSDLPGHGAVLLIAYSAVLGDGETLSIAANLQDATSIAGVGAADFGDALANAVIATGGTGGTTVKGVVEVPIKEFNGNRGFVQAQVTADLSAATTDTVAIAAVLLVGGAHNLPAASGVQSNA